jgi:hypothetical protein
MSSCSIATTRQEGIMKETKYMMLKHNETCLRQIIDRAEVERTIMDSDMQKISISCCNQLVAESEQSERELLQEVRQQQKFNDAFHRICGKLVAITVFERVRHEAEDVQNHDHSSTLDDFINVSAGQTVLKHDRLDVAAANGSFDISEIKEVLNAHIADHVCCLVVDVLCEGALTTTTSECEGHEAESALKTNHSSAFLEFTKALVGDSLLNYDILDTIPANESFEISGVQNALETQIADHVCCFAVPNLVDPNSQQICCNSGLELSSQSDHFQPPQTGKTPFASPQELQSELALMSQDPVTPVIHSQSQLQDKEKPVCWKHGCQGRVFSSWSNLRRHQREKAREEPACYCPRCGAYFSRVSGRNQHLANSSCTRIRRYSNGRIRPSLSKTQGAVDTQL